MLTDIKLLEMSEEDINEMDEENYKR